MSRICTSGDADGLGVSIERRDAPVERIDLVLLLAAASQVQRPARFFDAGCTYLLVLCDASSVFVGRSRSFLLQDRRRRLPDLIEARDEVPKVEEQRVDDLMVLHPVCIHLTHTHSLGDSNADMPAPTVP